MFAYRRFVEFAVLVWSAVLASTCQSFSSSTLASRTAMTNDGQRQRSVSLHSGTPVQEELDTTSTTATTPDVAGETTSEASSSALTALFPDDRQILRFVEPQTNVTVMLIGSMHYNPASIQLVEKSIEDLGGTNQLGSVIIESCDIRWNKTQEIMNKKKNSQKSATITSVGNKAENFIDSSPNDQDFLGNEMRAAWEVATKYHRPTVLGDQRINITMDALKDSLKETTKDLFLGGPSGWKRSKDEIADNWEKTIPVSAGQTAVSSEETENEETRYLNAFAFFDPRLLLCLPVSLVKYPLSFLVKDPVPVGLVFLAVAVLNFYADGTTSLFDDFSFDDLVTAYTEPKDYQVTDYLASFGIAVLETVIFARLLLKPLLADRNEILAKSVLDQCQLYAASSSAEDGSESVAAGQKTNGFGRFFQNLLSSSQSDMLSLSLPTMMTGSSNADTEEEPPIYVPGSDPESMKVAAQRAGNVNAATARDEGKVVVAVLGMAHCNGVMKLLKEQKV